MYDRLKKLEEWREACQIQQAMYTDEQISVGEFTYGVPDVRKWDKTTKLKIGKFCSIAGGVQILLGGEHHTEWLTTYPFDVIIDNQPTASKGDVIIGNDVWIGNNVTILSGVTIGDGAVIGAGALVAKDVEPFSVMAGVPARPIGTRWSAMSIYKAHWWDWPLEKIAEALPILTSKDVGDLAEFDRGWPNG